MIIEFTVRNFRSFSHAQTISLVAATDDTLKDNTVENSGFRLLRSVGVYGANASGKSNLVRAIGTLKSLVLNSAAEKPGAKLSVAPFKLDGSFPKQPSEFSITFLHKGVRYEYELKVDDTRVHYESLVAYPKGYPQQWFERSWDGAEEKTDWYFGSYLKGEKASIQEKTRPNVLFLSAAAQWNNEQLSRVYDWFKSSLQVVTGSRSLQDVTAEIIRGFESYEDLKRDVAQAIVRMVKKADFGITSVKVREQQIEKIQFDGDIPEEVQAYIRQMMEKDRPLRVEFVHENKVTGDEATLSFEEESSGTQRFFQMLGPWVTAMYNGFSIVLDEFEASLHPKLTRELLKLIQNPEISPSGAQLLFTTHDTTLLDPTLIRRDQVWFTEKDTGGATHLFAMTDYKDRTVRKGEALQKGYLSGRYGAVPILDQFGLADD